MPIYALHDRTPQLPPEGRYWIAPNASLIGDIVLGEDCGVWFGATLRGRQRTALDRRPLEYSGRRDPAHRSRLSSPDRRGLHDRAQRDPARLQDRRRLARGDGRDHSQRRDNRSGMSRGRRRAADGGQDISGSFADRRVARKGRAPARRGRGCPAARFLRPLRRELAPFRRRARRDQIAREKGAAPLRRGRPQHEANGGHVCFRAIRYQIRWRRCAKPDADRCGLLAQQRRFLLPTG